MIGRLGTKVKFTKCQIGVPPNNLPPELRTDGAGDGDTDPNILRQFICYGCSCDNSIKELKIESI